MLPIQREMVTDCRQLDSRRIICIGKEHVKQGHFIHKELYISPSLRNCIFGSNFYRAKGNIVHKTAQRTILHVWSAAKIITLLSFANKYAATIDRRTHKFTLCGKIDYRKNGVRSYAYIIEETDLYLIILKKDNNTEILCKKEL